MFLKPGLYLVSTPIGNLDDITLRALNVLKNSDIVLCEDTRISQKLLAKYNISAHLQVYNDHSDEDKRKSIITDIANGKVVSLISDAGTPLISDPGYKLVRQLKEANMHIDAIPGVSSVITALTLSGLPSDRFLFAGFLPKTNEGRKKAFQQLMTTKATLIFFETASRLLGTLEVARAVFGSRQCCVARELTKLYQESPLLKIDDMLDYYKSHPIKGEIVLLISGEAEEIESEDLNKRLSHSITILLAKGVSAKDITAILYAEFNQYITKKEIYDLVNRIKKVKDSLL